MPQTAHIASIARNLAASALLVAICAFGVTTSASGQAVPDSVVASEIVSGESAPIASLESSVPARSDRWVRARMKPAWPFLVVQTPSGAAALFLVITLALGLMARRVYTSSRFQPRFSSDYRALGLMSRWAGPLVFSTACVLFYTGAPLFWVGLSLVVLVMGRAAATKTAPANAASVPPVPSRNALEAPVPISAELAPLALEEAAEEIESETDVQPEVRPTPGPAREPVRVAKDGQWVMDFPVRFPQFKPLDAWGGPGPQSRPARALAYAPDRPPQARIRIVYLDPELRKTQS